MITLSANFQNACIKQTNQSIFQLDLETSYNRAKATMKEDWTGQGTSGDVDTSTIDGSVICKKSFADQLLQSSYGYATTGAISNTALYNSYGVRIVSNYDAIITKLVFWYSYSTSGEESSLVISEINDDINDPNWITWLGDFTIAELTSAGSGEVTINCNIPLKANRSYFLKMCENTDPDGTKEFRLWNPNVIISGNSGIKGFNARGFQIGQAVTVQNGNYIRNGSSYYTNLQAYGMTISDSFNGQVPLKELWVEEYSDSTLTTKLFTVLDQYGTAQAANVGQFRATERTPNDTSVDYDVHVYASGVAIRVLGFLSPAVATVNAPNHGFTTGDTVYVYNSGIPAASYTITVTSVDTFTFSLSGSGSYYGGACYKKMTELTGLSDGDTIDFDGHPNCRFVMSLDTSRWYLTPIVDAVEAYFPTSQSFVKSDDSYGTARPLLQSIPGYESQLDPIGSKCSVSEPQFRLLFDKPPDKSMSDVERIIYNSYLTGNEAAVTFGFKHTGMTAADFCPVTTGIIKDYKVERNFVTFNCSDVLRLAKDPFGFDSGGGIQQVLYAYIHPVDILLDLLYRIGVPHRLIDTASFTTVKSSFTGWQFYRYFDEYETDLKSLIDEICELLMVFMIPQEDGIVYLKYPFADSSVFTFDDNNSYGIGMAETNLDYRINHCEVRRGFWDEYNCVENENDVYWSTVINYDSQRQMNRNTPKVYDNKWIPRDVTVGGKYISQIVGERKTQYFGYGVTFLKRGTPIAGDEYAKIQVGDKVTVTTDQILSRGSFGIKTKTAIVISKRYDIEQSTIEWGLWIL